MKVVVVSFLIAAGNAFQVPSNRFLKPALLTRQTTALNALTTAPAAKQTLMDVVDRIKDEYGVLIYDSTAKSELADAVEELESVSSPPTEEDFEKFFKGDWTLLCTTATNQEGIDTSRLPFLKDGPFKSARESLNRRVKILQKIRSSNETVSVDRVDHVIEHEPPKSLEDIVGEVPDVLKSLNLNPLELTKSKFTLIHKADVESVTKTNLALQSVVVNIAGRSQFLDPAGADVLGLNVPLGEFLNSGSFETTYIDDTLRISRSKTGMIDQLRVFVRTDSIPVAEIVEEDDFVTEQLMDAEEAFETEASSDPADDYPSDVEME